MTRLPITLDGEARTKAGNDPTNSIENAIATDTYVCNRCNLNCFKTVTKCKLEIHYKINYRFSFERKFSC